MFKVKIITQGKTKESWLQEALSEYEKRMLGKLQIQWVLVNTEKELEERALKEEKPVFLDLQGKMISSEELSVKMFQSWGTKISFIIGGANGFSAKLLNHAQFSICLSKMTFTHQMVRLILVEQLYRALEIQEGSNYHK